MNKTKLSFLALTTAAVVAFGFRSFQDKQLLGYDKSNMDLTADPCKDFYQYAVGGWLKNNAVPATESRWGSFNILSEQNDKKIRQILDELETKADSTLSFNQRMVRDFYRSAMDSNAIDYYGFKPLFPAFSEINGLSRIEDMPRVLGALKTLGVDALFSFYITADAKQSLKNSIYISQGGINLPDVDYYTKKDPKSDQIRKDYTQHIEKMLKLSEEIKPQKGEKTAAQKAETILQIETDLAAVSMTRAERRDPEKTYNNTPFLEMNIKYSYFRWNEYFAANFLTSYNNVIVTQPQFFEGLKKILPKYTVEDWKAYFKWCLIHDYAGAMGAPFENESFRFYSEVLRGVSVMKPRQERALAAVNSYLGEPLGQLFVEKHFSEDSKKRVAEMVEELRDVFKERIDKLDWMSDSTKERAKTKLQAFKYKIGYPDNWKDFSKVELKYNEYLQNVMKLRMHAVNEMRAKNGKSVDPREWNMSPQTVNAYYSSNRNEIVFPAGILQPPFFDPNAEDALNYGGIGAVIGHEFSHGFDDKGSKFDHLGNLRNWWTETDLTRFQERTGKIVTQFNSFEVLDKVFINGSLTQGENIADLAGLTLSYYALQKHYQKYPAPAVSPDGFTWQQRFFLGWSIVWAQNINEKELRNRIITDPHSPGRYRVMGPLSNMPEFAQAFSCKAGDPMVANEKNQVKIW